MTHSLSHVDEIINIYKFSVKYLNGNVLHSFSDTNIHHSKKALLNDMINFLWIA